MNKKLGPGTLFILSLILLYLGGTLGGVLGAGLSVGGLVCFVASIIGGIKKLTTRDRAADKPDLDMTGPDSIQNTVKIQLHCYKAYRSKYPKEDPTEIYVRVLADRPGYDRNDIKAVLNQAHSPSFGKYNFRSVVKSMLLQEQMEDNNGNLSNTVINEIVTTVERIIPANL